MATSDIPVKHELSDQEIIERILGGDKNAYAIIIRRYNQRLYRVGMSILNDDAEVEEAMQEAYIHAYEKLAGFRFASSFATWLTRIQVNECLQRIKKRNRVLLIPEETISEKYLQHMQDHQTPESRFNDAEVKQILEQAIRQLPEIYRTVFILRELEDLNVAETGECLDISEGNVKVRLNRARVMLKGILEKSYRKEEVLHFHLNRCDRLTEQVLSRI